MNNKIETLEIDLSEYPKDLLIRFIIFAHENNLTCNEAFVKLLTDYLLKLDSDSENENQLQLPLE
jgi:hypothetical protein